MKPAYITCILNEDNLIFYNLIYYYNLGIRDFYIIFNNSNDMTRSEVRRFIDLKKDINVHTEDDTEIAYRQPQRFKMLADMAFGYGCDWIIPVDADEILKLAKYKTIQEFLNGYEPVDFGYITMSWIDYHETNKDDKDENNIFLRWKYRNQFKRQVSKILVKWHPDMMWGDGHHLVTKKRKDLGRSKVAVCAHFPNRGRNQLRRKIIAIGQAMIDTFGEDSERPQVQKYFEWKRHGEKVFDETWEWVQKYRRENQHKFVYDPISKSMFSY